MSQDFLLSPLSMEEFRPLFGLGDEELSIRSAMWIVADADPCSHVAFRCRMPQSGRESSRPHSCIMTYIRRTEPQVRSS